MRNCVIAAFSLFLLCSLHSVVAMAMKRILVTGGNKGIGKAICQQLVSQWSDTHVVLGSRDAARGEKAIEDIIQEVGSKCKDRLELMILDTSSDASVKDAAEKFKGELYGIINNAGIGFDWTVEEQVATNYFGPRRVNEAFRPFLKCPGGRIVNVASASGPNYVSSLPAGSKEKELLSKPWTIPGGIAQVDEMAAQTQSVSNGYGFSKALLNAYTHIHAKLEKDLIINSVTPGYIVTDLTAGMGATNPPSKGAVPPCFLMMDEETIPNTPTGRYYGSDCIRSPISFYRGPGEAPYENDEDLADLPETAKQQAFVLK